jgi:ABC-type lipoprotein export system ATPase subunit
MPLLSLEWVTKRYPRGGRERVALRDIWLQVDDGELVAVWGRRRSGRTTLLRVAGGLDRPDEGVVRFNGRDLRQDRDGVLGDRIGYVRTSFNAAHGERVVDHVALGLLARGVQLDRARGRADAVLGRAGVADCADLEPQELGTAEAARVAVARAMIAEPRLLLVDEPTKGVDLSERDGILSLLRSIADEGVAVLTTAGEATELAGADRALSIADGELRGAAAPAEAQVVPLPRARAGPWS